jgi:uncharacterized membrane protein YqjE
VNNHLYSSESYNSDNSGPTIAQLVSDLMADASQLIHQEVALAKHEIHGEIRKTTGALAALGVGIGLAALGGLLLIIMVVHLLNALTPLPLWACYGIVGGACAIGGLIALYMGKQRISQIDIVPQHTVATVKENVRWIKEKTRAE